MLSRTSCNLFLHEIIIKYQIKHYDDIFVMISQFKVASKTQYSRALNPLPTTLCSKKYIVQFKKLKLTLNFRQNQFCFEIFYIAICSQSQADTNLFEIFPCSCSWKNRGDEFSDHLVRIYIYIYILYENKNKYNTLLN